jgi:hypothetical protein
MVWFRVDAQAGWVVVNPLFETLVFRALGFASARTTEVMLVALRRLLAGLKNRVILGETRICGNRLSRLRDADGAIDQNGVLSEP